MAEAPELTILTGFLGSGKTTLLLDFLRQPEAEGTAVIMNEIGQIPLDGAVITASTEDVPVAMLGNGCVCCSSASDLTVTVEKLLGDGLLRGGRSFRRIILETSGMSRPAPILRSLAGIDAGLPTKIVAAYDCNLRTAPFAYDENIAQLAGAHVGVLTKQDIATASDAAAARRDLATLNPLMHVLDLTDRRQLALEAFSHRTARPFSLPSFAACDSPEPLGTQVVLARLPGEVDWDELAEWLDNVAAVCGEGLLRIKGLARVKGAAHMVLIQSVGTTFSTPSQLPNAPRDPAFLVIITRGALFDAISAVETPLPISLSVASGGGLQH